MKTLAQLLILVILGAIAENFISTIHSTIVAYIVFGIAALAIYAICHIAFGDARR
jgi:hypothetical protein